MLYTTPLVSILLELLLPPFQANRRKGLWEFRKRKSVGKDSIIFQIVMVLRRCYNINYKKFKTKKKGRSDNVNHLI
jgi:hypothetical protein